ncbi:hypothetical protein BPT24_244 [Tenacibaculum phage pT24]|uniref:Uncharacterized protein n=1 Tax=Tenacibaculum phage pT24 TaxID=1880590 RepID=A0A1W7GKQ2_9CAUD|nr:hypothetical protein HYP10_gp284 [Tenacibaculum phage pT24]BAX25562.1 hypothetical protein BPT24_244 [Tenacibaculum phage pT24]
METEKGNNQQPILTSIIDLFFSEVELLLTTKPMDVLGNNDFGFDAEGLIWRLNANEAQIKSELKNAISKYCFTNEELQAWDVGVRFMQGNERDIALIDILAKPYDGDAREKTFLFD